MKKWIVIFSIVGISFSASAQVDTFSLNNMPGNYYLPDWPDSSAFVPVSTHDGLNCPRCLYIGAPFCHDTSALSDNVYSCKIWEPPYVQNTAVGQYADTSIRIAGVALFYPQIIFEATSASYLTIRDEWLSHGYDILRMQLLDTNMNVMSEGVSFLVDSVDEPVFLINYREVSFASETRLHTRNRLLVPFNIYEVYFSAPISVSDSFYLSFHLENSNTDENRSFPVPGIYELHSRYNYPNAAYDFPTVLCLLKGGYQCVFDSASWAVSYVPVTDMDEWFTVESCEENHGFAMIFPILAVDCEAPDSVVWAPMGGGNVRVSWEQGQWVSGWEVSYGPTGTLPSEGTVLQTTTPSVMLGGITMDTDYVVYVRSLCTVRDTVWSEWSDGTPFTLRPQRIEAVEAADVTLQPNPASGAVLLMAEAALTGVEVYTAAGAPFLRLPATGSALRIDTSTWPSGAYLLDVSTARGTTTKRLVVTH